MILFNYNHIVLFVLNSAETETKAKLEKVAEIKKINASMMAIKSEISKYEDTLKEYQMYRTFLENLTPPVCKEFKMLHKKPNSLQNVNNLIGYIKTEP